ncbi:flagellar motor switch protein FliG [Tranquillimonas alkanivorans]|uniref:Flagellar motor switch protein FliG n=1 Tax=Tranquillimonas alkanivorans TaxID=441119 RepID=A0A1I5QV72_9RHOB|nr:FliG C-terminal domain-containing protein [Tranquillimonas alkanivorans]SFP49931.1 flagellar motor switch protein FliG [Tranquillimonas alkanivorans]
MSGTELSTATDGNWTAGADSPAAKAHLTRRQKAAVVVRLLLAEGAQLPLSELPESLQTELAAQMSQMRYIDRATLQEVVEEFAAELEAVGLSFPGGLDGVLSILEGAISPDIAARLRSQSGLVWTHDPWDTIAEIEVERLLPFLREESAEVAAVILSKLKVSKAAELLGRLPGDRARRITYAVSETAEIAPDTVRRIGLSLAAALKAEPPRAFVSGAVDRVGAILNVSEADTREGVLKGLEEEDEAFAAEVRRAIFTFEDIPRRVEPLDVPVILRSVDQSALVTIVAATDPKTQDTVEFLMDNMSKRMAGAIRDEAGELAGVKAKQAENARRQVLDTIRQLLDSREITLVGDDD